MALNRINTVFVHLVSWLLFFSLIISFDAMSAGHQHQWTELFSADYLVFYVVYTTIFYGNLYVLVPAFYLKKRIALYIAVIGLLFLAVYLIQPFDHIFNHGASAPPEPRFGPPPGDGMPPPPRGGPPGSGQRHIDIVSIILFLMIWSLSTAIQIIKQWRSTEQRAVQAEAGKAVAELSFLKAQVNPHFLFNTLNNIYSLAVTNSEQTPEAILKLSNIMRYMTDEVLHDFVPLDQEVEWIRDYIDLQRIRLNNQTQIGFTVSGQTTGKMIAPLILMTFIENIFKYGISSHEPAGIEIRISTDDRSVRFYCRNTIFSGKQKAGRTGTGIINTKKRLQHLYPSKHTLMIDSQQDVYTVNLTLEL